MGEKAHKIDRSEAESRLVALRSQIAMKRTALEQEVSELHRRRKLATQRVVKLATAGGAVTVTLMCLTSMGGAVMRAIKGESDFEDEVKKDAKMKGTLGGAVGGLAMWALSEVARRQMSKAMDKFYQSGR